MALNLRNCRLPRVVIEPRIYRAAFVPALLAVVLDDVLVPEPRRGRSRRDSPRTCCSTATWRPQLARPHRGATRPTAAPARAATCATAQLVADTFETRGFGGGAARRPLVQRFTHAGRELVNVVGRRAGSSRRQIVIVAARDAATVPERPAAPPTPPRCMSSPASPGPAVREDARARVRRRLDARARSGARRSSDGCRRPSSWTP